jgi:hypothetical protein
VTNLGSTGSVDRTPVVSLACAAEVQMKQKTLSSAAFVAFAVLRDALEESMMKLTERVDLFAPRVEVS